MQLVLIQEGQPVHSILVQKQHTFFTISQTLKNSVLLRALNGNCSFTSKNACSVCKTERKCTKLGRFFTLDLVLVQKEKESETTTVFSSLKSVWYKCNLSSTHPVAL